jgi:hypothetical protein
LKAHRDHALEIDLRRFLERPKIVLALPGFDRQRLSDIDRGWCPLFRRDKSLEKGVIRSDRWKLTACRKVRGF